MLDKVKDAMSTYGMVSNGDSVAIGLSGGADSVSLLVALYQLKSLYGLELCAIHINHQLRGGESLRDENFCIELCNQLNVPLTVRRIDVQTYCESKRLSIEEGARILRYEAFKSLPVDKVATAHTLSDSCETIVYNLARGTGLKGLMGIPPIRGNVIRPLIHSTRADVENFLKVNGFSYVTDSTNLSDDHTRNRIRHSVIPILKELNPQFEKKVLDAIKVLSEENDYIDTMVDRVYSVSDDSKTLNVDIRKYDVAIRRRCIMKFLKENNLEYSREKVLLVDDTLLRGGKINVSKDVYLVTKLGIISIVKIPKNTPTCGITSMELPINGQCKILNKVIRTHLDKSIRFINKKLTYYVMDYDKIQGKALIRNRVFGDKIRLENRTFTSSVKKLINEYVPKEFRQSLCFIADDDGLICMERFGVSERVSCSSHTKNYLIVEILEESKG